MLELSIDEIATVKSIVEKEKRVKISWLTKVSKIEEERIINDVSRMGLRIDGEYICTPDTERVFSSNDNLANADITLSERNDNIESESGIEVLEKYSFSIDDDFRLENGMTFRPGIEGLIKISRCFNFLIIIVFCFFIYNIVIAFKIPISEKTFYIVMFVIVSLGTIGILVIVTSILVLPTKITIMNDRIVYSDLFKKLIIDYKNLEKITCTNKRFFFKSIGTIKEKNVHFQITFFVQDFKLRVDLNKFNYDQSLLIKALLRQTVQNVVGDKVQLIGKF